MTRKGISRGALAVWEVAAGLAAALLIGLVLLIFTPRTWLWYSLLWLIGLAFVLAAFLYLPLLYISCCYIVTEEYVEYQSGVIFFTRRRMLKSSIMYVTILKSPLSPLLKTRTVVFSAMGGKLIIPFLPVRNAVELMRETAPKKRASGGERHV